MAIPTPIPPPDMRRMVPLHSVSHASPLPSRRLSLRYVDGWLEEAPPWWTAHSINVLVTPPLPALLKTARAAYTPNERRRLARQGTRGRRWARRVGRLRPAREYVVRHQTLLAHQCIDWMGMVLVTLYLPEDEALEDKHIVDIERYVHLERLQKARRGL